MASTKTMKWRLSYLIFITMVLLMECIYGSREGQLSSYYRGVFRNGSDMGLSQMVVSNESGTDFVYVGGMSVLYQLDLDLMLLRQESTIPMDESKCEDPACLYETKILEVAPSPIDKLIQCGGPEGKCEFRDLRDISRDLGYTVQFVVNDGTSVGVIAFRQFENPQVFMYVATSPNNPPGTVSRPITQRELEGASQPQYLFEYSGTIPQFYDDYEYAVDYIQGVGWKTYNFFIVHSGPGEKSKLGRICSDNNQEELDTYSEILLSCQSYDTLQAVHIGSNDVLYGVFTNGTHSALCLYTMEDVEEMFVDATCGCAKSVDTTCNGQGKEIAYLTGESFCRTELLNEQRDEIEQCGYFRPEDTKLSRYKYAQAMNSLPGTLVWADLPGQKSSIITFSKENETCALVTTSSVSTATLSKIHVKPDGTGRLYETVDLEVESEVLTDVYISQESEELFILTNKEILKLAVVNCSQYTSCTECIGPTTDDGDPFCGWCTLETKCSRSSECDNSDSDSSIWLQYNQDCIAINDLNPPSQELDSAPLTVSFSVSQLPPLEANSEYTCRFDSIATSTNNTGNSFSCMTPAIAQRPRLPDGQDYVPMSLGILSSTTNNIIVEADFPFFMCSAITSCSECVSSAWGCDWCVYESRCTLDGASSCTIAGADEVVIENNNELSCPRLDDLSTEILIPVGLSRTIYLTGSNLPTMNGVSYRCILTDGSELRTVNVDHFNGTSVQCEATVYNLASPSTLEEQVTIHVEYKSDVSSTYQPLDKQDNSVTLFQCSANGMSCRSCVTTTVRAQLGCGWCVESSSGACQVNADDEQCSDTFLPRGSSEDCPAPSISGIFPSAGPLEGNTTLTISGTNLAAEFNETINITVAGIECSLNDFEPGLSVDCITGSPGNQTRSGTVTVVFEFGTAESDDSFIFRDPAVYEFAPETGIVSGGTEINITGQYLDTGRNIQVSVGDADCIMMEERPSSELIQCITSPLPDTSEMDNVSVIVTFDGTRKEVPGKYRFISDPTIEDYSPKETIMSGGIEVTVTGSGFSIVQSAVMELTIGDEVVMEECSVNSDVEIQCLTPDLQNYTSSTSASSRKRRQATDVETAFVLDGFRYNPSESLTLFPDPVYEVVVEYIITNPGGTQMLKGENLNVPAENTENFVTLCFGKTKCQVTGITATELTFLSPAEEPEGGVCKGDNVDPPDELNIVVFHGENLRQYLGTARYSVGDGAVAKIVGGAVGGVVFLCIIVFLVFVCVGHRNYKAQIKHTEMEMENLMQHSRRQVMEGFFIDQEMTDTEEQLRGLGMPFVSNHDYMKSMLFFGLDVKPATTDPEIPSDMEQRAMLEFSKLLSNKNFLITIIHTLDNCKQITTQKKANIASLLTVVLVMERKFRYFTDVLVTLMSETISDAADRQRIKQLFKRTLTLEDKMLNNWIALAMFQSIKGYVGQPLYMLYQAIKIQCEKGPVDAVTGKSFFSLNFDNLLTEEVDFEELTLNVDSEIGQEPVKVLNVDTITQVKEKILDAMYRKKHTKYQRSAREVDLVIKSGKSGELVISDYDTSTQPSMGWCPINTLQHYGIQSGTLVGLTDKQDMPNTMPIPMNDGANNLFNDTTRKSVRVTGHHEYNSHDLERGPSNLKYYHLVQTEDSEEQVEEKKEGFCGRMQRVLCFKGTQGKRKIREIYLQRLVSVKQSINNFVAQALDAMFTIREDSYVNNVNNIPFALRFLFNFFDEEASRYDDNVTAATWKNNILPLRFWSTILAHPSFIFNMRQSRTADSSVVVLNQMLDNACKGVVPTLKMNASPSRLLFNKELPDYINLLSMYYRNIQQTPTLEETELREECTRIDEEFSGLFSRLTTLKQLYECIRPHETLLVKALQEDDECHAAHFADSLQRVGNTLDQPAD